MIDQQGQLFWVQARPITALASDLREFDTQVPAGEVVTRCNIGEMMPGACCPLTLSITGRGIEQGMQHMHLSYAGRPAITDDWTQVAISHGQMFINLSGGAVASASVLGVTVESMGLNICGRIVPGLTGPPAKSFLIRVLGFVRLVRYVLAADSSIDALKADLNHFDIDMSTDSASLIQAIDDAIPMLHRVYRVHLQSSATSGFTGSILQAMLARESKDQADQDAEVARLLAGATQVESAVLVDELDEISRAILKLGSEHAGAFAELPTESALDWLEKQAPEKVKRRFSAFLQRHGHRGYRELCLRQPSWSQAPGELVVTIQTSVKAQLNNATVNSRPDAADLSRLSKSLRWIVEKAHKAIRRRETTKSLLVLTTHTLSRAYRQLGERLVKQDVLADIDQLFFFSHGELKRLLRETGDTSTDTNLWIAKADKRRRALEFQNKLRFEEVCYGQPQPLDIHTQTADQSAEISGRAVSQGVVEGFARVAHSVQEASALQAGEILVAPITDVGWTPYFNLIAGLVTDLGSSVSHGAVIAREYGLPAIVNTRTGTRKIATGDFIRLNADNGTVERLHT
ncbi:MAG: PEP-utilizing enzyme, partial [Pseudomonadota bacterium]